MLHISPDIGVLREATPIGIQISIKKVHEDAANPGHGMDAVSDSHYRYFVFGILRPPVGKHGAGDLRVKLADAIDAVGSFHGENGHVERFGRVVGMDTAQTKEVSKR